MAIGINKALENTGLSFYLRKSVYNVISSHDMEQWAKLHIEKTDRNHAPRSLDAFLHRNKEELGFEQEAMDSSGDKCLSRALRKSVRLLLLLFTPNAGRDAFWEQGIPNCRSDITEL